LFTRQLWSYTVPLINFKIYSPATRRNTWNISTSRLHLVRQESWDVKAGFNYTCSRVLCIVFWLAVVIMVLLFIYYNLPWIGPISNFGYNTTDEIFVNSLLSKVQQHDSVILLIVWQNCITTLVYQNIYHWYQLIKPIIFMNKSANLNPAFNFGMYGIKSMVRWIKTGI